LEQAAVVNRIFLLAAAPSQIQQADQVTLADQWHRDLDASLLQRTQSWRIHLQPVNLHQTRRAQEISQQRVVWSNIELHRLRLMGQLHGGRYRGFRRRLGFNGEAFPGFSKKLKHAFYCSTIMPILHRRRPEIVTIIVTARVKSS
jgi:hypothetical protein